MTKQDYMLQAMMAVRKNSRKIFGNTHNVGGFVSVLEYQAIALYMLNNKLTYRSISISELESFLSRALKYDSRYLVEAV